MISCIGHMYFLCLCFMFLHYVNYIFFIHFLAQRRACDARQAARVDATANGACDGDGAQSTRGGGQATRGIVQCSAGQDSIL